MEEINQIIEVLMNTPKLALWSLVVWCLFVLSKLASVVYAIKAVAVLAINKWHASRMKTLENRSAEIELEVAKANIAAKEEDLRTQRQIQAYSLEKNDLLKLKKAISANMIGDGDLDLIRELFSAMKKTTYIHESDIRGAIDLINKSKNN